MVNRATFSKIRDDEGRGHFSVNLAAWQFWISLLGFLVALPGVFVLLLNMMVPKIASGAVEPSLRRLENVDRELKADMQRENAAQDARSQELQRQILDELRDLRAQLNALVRDEANRRDRR